jgi:hypothetical protein
MLIYHFMVKYLNYFKCLLSILHCEKCCFKLLHKIQVWLYNKFKHQNLKHCYHIDCVIPAGQWTRAFVPVLGVLLWKSCCTHHRYISVGCIGTSVLFVTLLITFQLQHHYSRRKLIQRSYSEQDCKCYSIHALEIIPVVLLMSYVHI